MNYNNSNSSNNNNNSSNNNSNNNSSNNNNSSSKRNKDRSIYKALSTSKPTATFVIVIFTKQNDEQQ